jgi:hypothetical protein
MSKQAKYLFVSVPSSITPSGHKDDAIQSLQSAVNESYGSVNALNIPEFKIGTLDALLQQSEELARLEGLCQGVVSKVGDTLKNILDGNEEKMAQHKAVNDSMLCLVPYGQSSLQVLTSAQNRWTNTSDHSLGTRSSTGQTSLSLSY